jgi:hypothetical protein
VTRKLLDILIPAYGNADGVEKILTVVASHLNCRIIVSDDSLKPSNINAIRELCVRYRVIYKMGPRSGAVANWNFLLSLASSTYCVLVHHDECFSNTMFICELAAKQDTTEAMVLPLVVKNSSNVSRYVYSWQQNLLIRCFRPFGPMLNILGGPTALLIFKTSRSTRFNPNLVYQVDCEWYAKVLSGVDNKNIYFCRGTNVVSTFNSGSITSSIRANLKEIIQSDKEVLKRTSWGNMMYQWLCIGTFVTFIYRLVLLPSFIPFYLKRILLEKNVNR